MNPQAKLRPLTKGAEYLLGMLSEIFPKVYKFFDKIPEEVRVTTIPHKPTTDRGYTRNIGNDLINKEVYVKPDYTNKTGGEGFTPDAMQSLIHELLHAGYARTDPLGMDFPTYINTKRGYTQILPEYDDKIINSMANFGVKVTPDPIAAQKLVDFIRANGASNYMHPSRTRENPEPGHGMLEAIADKLINSKYTELYDYIFNRTGMR